MLAGETARRAVTGLDDCWRAVGGEAGNRTGRPRVLRHRLRRKRGNPYAIDRWSFTTRACRADARRVGRDKGHCSHSHEALRGRDRRADRLRNLGSGPRRRTKTRST
jgi:hypothetical protein